MSKGICVAGLLTLNTTYPIARFPQSGQLTGIVGEPRSSSGGAVCNVLMSLARLDPALPLSGQGVVGADDAGALVLSEMRKLPSIDLTHISQREGASTSYTIVMQEEDTAARTFFHWPGGNCSLRPEDISWDAAGELLHFGYLLALDELDAADPEYGTRLARVLHEAQQRGIATSVDVVSESSERYKKIVPPSLRYADYCIINELEAQQITGIPLRSVQGVMFAENMQMALESLQKMGVARWVVIHAPKGGFGLDKAGHYAHVPAIPIAKEEIRSTTGAGDAFCAGVLYAAYHGQSLEEALFLGNATAARALRHENVTDSILPVEETKAWARARQAD